MEGERSRSSLSDADDYDNSQEADNGEDYEATIDEEEMLEGNDYGDELRALEDEGEMSLEDLRKMYGYPPAGEVVDEDEEELENEDETEVEEEENGTEGASHNAETSFFGETGNSLSGLDDDDDDYCPPDPWRKNVRVDAVQFQAEIPSLLSEEERANSTGSDVRDDAVCLWSSDKSGATSDETLNQYLEEVIELRKAHEQHVPQRTQPFWDDEDALCALMRNEYDVEKAKQSFPFPHINVPIRTVREDALGWDEKEAKTFEESIETYGKDFPLIRRLKLPYRKVGELVEYYYQWKLTPGYRTWRASHPHHVPVIQSHVSVSQTGELHDHSFDLNQHHNHHHNNHHSAPGQSESVPLQVIVGEHNENLSFDKN